MILYKGEVSFKFIDGQHMQVDAESVEDAEFQLLELAKDDFPDAVEFTVENIEKVNA